MINYFVGTTYVRFVVVPTRRKKRQGGREESRSAGGAATTVALEVSVVATAAGSFEARSSPAGGVSILWPIFWNKV